MFHLVSKLRNLRTYKSCLVKRVSLEKGSVKMSTIFDMCVQQLLVLVLDPLSAPALDISNSVYRKSGTAHCVLGRVFRVLKSRDMWVYSLEISGFLKNIDQNWVLMSIPCANQIKVILKSVLKSGFFFERVTESFKLGIPQGNILSPFLVNFILSQAEGVLAGSLNITRYKKPVVCRFANDILILSRSRNMIITRLKPKLLAFLKEKGLCFLSNKSILFPIKEKPLQFLGYLFVYKYFKLNMFPAHNKVKEIRW